MAYLALYRKYRPSNFDEVVGQKPVVTALRNQIRYGCVGHAYLFCGTRGTGKTSVARVFAKAVNCLHPVDGNPCGECELCREAESSFNIIEIDAASNNGVDNIRDLRDEVIYTPVKGKYKVYIIDEVHMLTTSAFNALLKTLEEPPEHVIFLLATTEPQKVMQTILSRCQRYDFKRLTVAEMKDRLRLVCDQEKIDAEDEALDYIAQTADGGMRDALSLLDQCHAYYIQDRISLDKVQDMLGAVDNSVLGVLSGALSSGNTVMLLQTLDALYDQGRDPLQLLNAWTAYLRGVLLYRVLGEDADYYVTEREKIRTQMRELAAKINEAQLSTFIQELSRLAGQVKYSLQKRIVLETGLISLSCGLPGKTSAGPEATALDSALALRLERLERSVAELKRSGATAVSVPDVVVPKPQDKTPTVSVTQADAGTPEHGGPESGRIFEDWDAVRKRIIARYRPLMILNFFDAPVREGDAWVLATTQTIYTTQMEANGGERLKELEKQVQEVTGKAEKFVVRIQ